MAAPLGGKGAPHCPVLLGETIEFLAPQRGGLFVDCTLGLGGHSEAILESSEATRVIGFDLDPEALHYASERLAKFGARFRPIAANFKEIQPVLASLGEHDAQGVLVDLGVSSLQFDSPERGFSFRWDAPLDMRMNPAGDDETAAQLLQRLPEAEIARVLFEYGEERRSRRIARWIVEKREQGTPITSTKALADLVLRASGRSKTKGIHPATRTFQALRIAVNSELEGLDQYVATAIDLLQPDGRFVAISFHSLEDRIIKQELRRLAGYCQCPPRIPVCSCGARKAVEILTRRPVVPHDREVEENPRARSAKLRACRKLSFTTAALDFEIIWRGNAMNRHPLKHQNSSVHRERDLRALSRLALQLGCALLLAGGFVFAARQHFAAVRYGYESELLRTERQRLLDEQERLILEKERASSPARLESAARQLGLKPLQPGQVGTRKRDAGRQLPLAAALIQQSASFR